MNDHVLKHVVPSFVTGKLSDVAGLFLAPALFAALIRARTRRSVMIAHALVAIVFALVKTVPFATHLFEQSLSLIVRSHVWTDPTDLVALPMIALSWRVLVPVMERETRDGWLSRLAMACGSVMCVATSAPNVPPLTIKNHTKHAMDVTIKKTTADYDESIVFSSRALPLHPIVFDGTSTTLHVGESGDATSNEALDKLVMVTIDLGTRSETFAVAFSGSAYELDIIDRVDGGVAIQANNTMFVRDMSGIDGCAPKPGKLYTLGMPLGTNAHTIASWTTTNGCIDVTFEEPVMHAYACIPEGAWPFQKGDKIKSEYGAAVRDDGVTRTSLSVGNPAVVPSVDTACVMQDSCGALALDSTIEVDGAKLHTGEEHISTTNGTTTHWYAGRTLQPVLVRSSCRDVFDSLSESSSMVVVSNGPSAPASDAGTD